MTNRQVEKAKPRERLRDARVPGLSLYVGAKSKTFYLCRRVYGTPRKIKIGRYPGLSVEQARRKALAVNGDIENGVFERPTTFEALWELYRTVKQTKRSLHQDEWLYDKELKRWADRKLSSIRSADCQRLHGDMVDTPIAANRTMALLSGIFSVGVRHGLIRENPVRAVTRYPERSRDRFLTREELPRFLEALRSTDDEFRDFVLLCLYTGARCGNVLSMRWQDVDGSVWTVPRTKNGRPQRVYLCREAAEVLERRRRAELLGDHVFQRRAIPHKRWRTLCKRAAVPGLWIHDLRRTLGSWQAATGASLPIIGKTLGHLSPRSTLVYARLDLAPVARAVDAAVTAMLTLNQEVAQ
jgi:integrase